MSAVSDADRMAAEQAAYDTYLTLPDAALDALTPREERQARTVIAAAIAEARAPYDRLTADVHELADEWDHAADRVLAENWTSEVRITTANMLTSAAARLRAVAAANEEARA